MRKLAKLGVEVHVLTRPDSNWWRVRGVEESVTQHQVDLLDASKVMQTVSAIKPRTIFHCAAYGGHFSEQDARRTVEINAMGTLNLLNAAVSTGFESFVNSGSSSEYGRKDRPMCESDVLEPATVYGAAKAAGTLIATAFARSMQLPVMTVRPFSPYGPFDARDRLVPKVVQACLSGEELHLASPGNARDFVFIDDVVDLYIRAAERPSPGEVVNCGSGRQHSVQEMVAQVMALTGKRVPLQWEAVAPRQFESQCWVADISKAERLYSWHPAFTLEEGLQETISWHRERLPR